MSSLCDLCNTDEELPYRIEICPDTLTERTLCFKCSIPSLKYRDGSQNKIHASIPTATDDDVLNERQAILEEKVSLNFPLKEVGKSKRVEVYIKKDNKRYAPYDTWKYYKLLSGRYRDPVTKKTFYPPLFDVNIWLTLQAYVFSKNPRAHILLSSLDMYKHVVDLFLRELVLDIAVLMREIPLRHRCIVSELMVSILVHAKSSEEKSLFKHDQLDRSKCLLDRVKDAMETENCPVNFESLLEKNYYTQKEKRLGKVIECFEIKDSDIS